MPAYSKLRVVELREICVERGINAEGLTNRAIEMLMMLQ